MYLVFNMNGKNPVVEEVHNGTEETILKDFLVIPKEMLQNKNVFSLRVVTVSGS